MFTEILPKDLEKSPFDMIGKQWMLITAGNKDCYNTMTASWGAMGVMWNKNVVFSFVRPQRYTFDFLNKNEYFSCAFFDESYRKALSFCGKYSGRDYDKAKECNLTPSFEEKAPYFIQANTVIVCKKLYVQPLAQDFIIDKSIQSNYSGDDYHHMFVGEIVKVLKK